MCRHSHESVRDLSVGKGKGVVGRERQAGRQKLVFNAHKNVSIVSGRGEDRETLEV